MPAPLIGPQASLDHLLTENSFTLGKPEVGILGIHQMRRSGS